MKENILSYDIIVTTYDMVKTKNMQSIIKSTYFHYVILDEGHVIKDSETMISETVRKIHSRNKLICTGTPLQNNLVELQSILNYLYPDVFIEDSFFRNAFDIQHNMIDKQMLLKANKLLNIFMIRRLKHEVEKMMPKKIETKVSDDLYVILLEILFFILISQTSWRADSLSIVNSSDILV